MSETTVEFFGGPCDGERRVLQDVTGTVVFPWYDSRSGMFGEHVYVLSTRYALPPLRYDYREARLPTPPG
jgi:hypothetical protein